MKNSFKPSFLFILFNRIRKRDFLYEFFFKGKKTLDVGCGQGEFLKNDLKGIIGVDSNKNVVEKLLHEGLRVAAGEAHHLPFDDNSFDCIHCRNVVEHLTVDKAYGMLKECSRVLKSGGFFILGSEMVTRKFWGTFGHIKPYPPGAIIKLLRTESREEFEGIAELEYLDVFYIGNYFKNKLLYFLSFFAGYYFPELFAREYFLVLRKKKDIMHHQ